PSTRLAELVAGGAKRLSSNPKDRPVLSSADVRTLENGLSTDTKAGDQMSESERDALRRRLQRRKEMIKAVRGDLDWITMKALDKDRRRRYETANGLAN